MAKKNRKPKKRDVVQDALEEAQAALDRAAQSCRREQSGGCSLVRVSRQLVRAARDAFDEDDGDQADSPSRGRRRASSRSQGTREEPQGIEGTPGDDSGEDPDDAGVGDLDAEDDEDELEEEQ